MSETELALDFLATILIAIERIERRFRGIDTPDDFVSGDDGIDRLDGIADADRYWRTGQTARCRHGY